MPRFPQLETQNTTQDIIDTFLGYDHQLKIPDGEWYETKNLTTDYSPMLANRKTRTNLNTSAIALAEKDALAYVDGSTGVLYYNFSPTSLVLSTDASMLPKQMVSMGAYLVIFPDKKYYNTEDPTDYGDMEATYTATPASYEMCRSDNTAITPTVSDTAPVNPSNADYWIDTFGETHILKQWSAAQNTWISVETVYIKITFTEQLGNLPRLFKKYDGVTISGSDAESVNGEKIIYDCGGANNENSWIMLTGTLDQIPSSPLSDVTIKREVPNMDYVCECQNRLWGCFYGRSNGENLNEIYCSALGDFKNWRQYMGLSTDSWTGSVGSDGVWTGAISYLGHPTFFKENRIHTVTISTQGAHRIDETVCRGVQDGSAASLCVVNETLYYKSRSDVCVYQGGFPTGISSSFGTELYHDAVAGAIGGKYYISMLDKNEAPHLFVYDITKNIWLHEDGLHATAFARVDDELFAVEAGNLISMLGSVPGAIAGAVGETGMVWEAVSGVQYYNYPDRKRVSRYNIRLKLAQGASFNAYIQYDSSGVWESAGQYTATSESTGTILFPVRPHRCDHLQIKLTGTGDVRVYSLARILEVGSDYR